MVQSMWANLRIAWGAATTGVSACLYLLDLATTASALMTYYVYQYKCPHADPASPLLRRDPICRIIRSNPDLHSISTEFWGCLAFLLMAYPIYAFVFWISLPSRQHPLRLAYFLPLIHLYRLLQVFRHSFSFKELEELQKKQRELNSLYNGLGAALETAPQFIIQFFIAARLGEFIRGSADVNMQAQQVPTNLVLSLVASLVSACYCTGLAVSLLMGLHVPFAKRVWVAIIVGCQTVATILGKAMTVAALGQFFKGFSSALLIYLIVGLALSWLFVGFSFQFHEHDSRGSKMWLKVLHSFALALVIKPSSPIFVIVKEGKSTCLLIMGTFVHILVELVGITLILLRPGRLKEGESPCHCLHVTRTTEECNKYLTCKIFLGILLSSIIVVVLTTLLFIWVMENEDDARDLEGTSGKAHIVYKQSTCSFKNYSLINAKVKPLSHISVQTLFGLILVRVALLFIRRLQTKCKVKNIVR